MQFRHFIFAVASCSLLAACGNTVTEQSLGGAVIGAGAAVVVSGSVLQGAAIGAAGNLAYCQLNPGRCN
ncbi:hypothetical protein [Roseobacter sp.]|uniref:hypothetical protein n=1 Tax=Roseobacter sp. TaxID=1907202 RepID=UPI0025F13FE2|nr:hypothetical protein [Roseobacter sp.]